MIKVLRIANRLNVGGPTFNVVYLSKYLPDEYETKILAGNIEPEEGSSAYILHDLGLEFTLVPTMFRAISFKKDYKAFLFIKKVIEEYRPDIIHTHAAKAGALGRIAAFFSKHKTKVIVHTYHGNVFDGYFSPFKAKIILLIERFLASISTFIVSISKQQKIDLIQKYKIGNENKINVVPLGFDLAPFTQNLEFKRKKFREEFLLDDKMIVITITGRLAAIKNHHFFIDVLKQLKKSVNIPFKAFIIGDGELMQDIINYSKANEFEVCIPGSNNFTADIIFTSWRKDIDIVNAGSDIITLTSLNEGTPVSIIEAMASSRAVVATNVGGIADIIDNGKTGIYCETEVQVFAASLAKLIENPTLRQQMGIKASNAVIYQFTYKRLVTDVDQLYKKYLN